MIFSIKNTVPLGIPGGILFSPIPLRLQKRLCYSDLEEGFGERNIRGFIMKKLIVSLLALNFLNSANITAYTIENRTDKNILARITYRSFAGNDVANDLIIRARDFRESLPTDPGEQGFIGTNRVDIDVCYGLFYRSNKSLHRTIKNVGNDDVVVITGDGESMLSIERK